MNLNLHKIYAPLPLTAATAAFAHPVLNKNECIHHVVCYSCCLLFPLHSFYLRIQRKSFVKLGEGEGKLSRPHYIKLLVFLCRRIIPTNFKRWKINWPKNAVASTFRPFGIARRPVVKMVSLPFFNNADCPRARSKNKMLCASCTHVVFHGIHASLSIIDRKAKACLQSRAIIFQRKHWKNRCSAWHRKLVFSQDFPSMNFNERQLCIFPIAFHVDLHGSLRCASFFHFQPHVWT